MTDGFVVQWTPARGRSRKVVFEQQPEDESRWARIEFELRESRWRQVGLEYLEDISVTGNVSTEPDHPTFDGGDADE